MLSVLISFKQSSNDRKWLKKVQQEWSIPEKNLPGKHLVFALLSYLCSGVRSCYDEGKRTAETLTMDYHRGENVEVLTPLSL